MIGYTLDDRVTLSGLIPRRLGSSEPPPILRRGRAQKLAQARHQAWSSNRLFGRFKTIACKIKLFFSDAPRNKAQKS